MAAMVAALLARSFCVRCGSEDAEVLGETRASCFFTCSHCHHVWSVSRQEMRQMPIWRAAERSRAVPAADDKRH